METADDTETQLRGLAVRRIKAGATFGQHGQQHDTPLHQTGGWIRTPITQESTGRIADDAPSCDGSGGGDSQVDQQERRKRWSCCKSPTRAYAYPSRPLIVGPRDTPGGHRVQFPGSYSIFSGLDGNYNRSRPRCSIHPL